MNRKEWLKFVVFSINFRNPYHTAYIKRIFNSQAIDLWYMHVHFYYYVRLVQVKFQFAYIFRHSSKTCFAYKFPNFSGSWGVSPSPHDRVKDGKILIKYLDSWKPNRLQCKPKAKSNIFKKLFLVLEHKK